ncbi:MarC family protein [Amylibacter sp.]|nr:MarC family protein [Amylibacter sp.]
MFELFVTAFVMLFLVIDPIGLLPIFISLTLGNNKNRLKIGFRACSVALGILLLFGLFGENLLNFIGIGMPAFKISGGLLLFLTAVEMLFSKRGQRREEQTEMDAHDDPSVFPLATPLIAGPGSMATMILLLDNDASGITSTFVVLSAMVSVVFLTFIFFSLGGPFERLLGKTGINVITRLMGMLLAALSVQFVVDGLNGLGII